ncbi:SPARC-related modular calcium-binding protein 1-like isoform X3 [Lineus longissimus]|uniref:SPARC-related modular calcium-binding protein 1-like isoform X3 n=1 Tax=Lineus longissimus TaxID=88925 RepID=UPI00315C7FD5
MLKTMDIYKQTILFFQLLGLLVLSVYSEDTKLITILVRNKRDSATSPPVTCPGDCSSVKVRPICASDGQTYPSRCEIKRLHDCDGKDIKVVKKGPCSDSTASKCFKERHQAQQLKKKNEAPSIGIYIPECNSDGTFAKVQCHKATQYCWCVTDDGKPVPGSSVRSKKPKCRRKAKRNKRKRGSKSRNKSKKRCNHSDRSTFNTNLITLFTEEYQRLQSAKPNKTAGITELPIKSESDSILDTPEKRVVEWKFTELDTDQDNQLKKKEIGALTRLVRKLVKPKPCARNFVKHCDLDKNRKIARNEWSVCLGVDLNISFRLFLLLNVDDQTTPTPSSNTKKDKPIIKDDLAGAALWSAQLRPSASDDKDEEEDEDNDEEVKDCSHERKVALEMHKTDPNGRIFIPRCSLDGKFERAQCHESTGYCWCVDAGSGKPIPGTSTYKVTPDCVKAVSKIIPVAVVVPGCPAMQKKRFLTTLIDAMTQDMVQWVKNNSDAGLPDSDPSHSLEERVVRWKLKNLDQNSNQALERREIRTLKMEIRKNDQVKKKKSLRKCARSFVEFCDADKNKKITMDEWTDCMGLNTDVNDQQPPLPQNPKRRGPNPFSKYLHS